MPDNPLTIIGRSQRQPQISIWGIYSGALHHISSPLTGLNATFAQAMARPGKVAFLGSAHETE